VFSQSGDSLIFGVKKGESHNVGIKRKPPEEVKQNFENALLLIIIREIEERMRFVLNSIEFYSLFCDIINLFCLKSSRIRIWTKSERERARLFCRGGGCDSLFPSVSLSFSPRTRDAFDAERGGRRGGDFRRRWYHVFRRGESVCDCVCVVFCVRETVFFSNRSLSLSLFLFVLWCRFETRALVARRLATRRCSHSRARVFVRVYYIFIYSSSDCVSFGCFPFLCL